MVLGTAWVLREDGGGDLGEDGEAGGEGEGGGAGEELAAA
jgi:hypothetical protein